MVLGYPAVMVLGYKRNGQYHALMLAFSVDGRAVVGLRIGASWSGWHGGWCRNSDGSVDIAVHYRGNPHSLRHVTIKALGPHLMYMFQRGERLWVDVLGIRTKLLTQKQLGYDWVYA